MPRQPPTQPWPESKTGRRYAVVSAAVRALAASGRPFTRLDLPQFDRALLTNRLWQMAISGELRIVRPGTCGRYGLPALYQLNPKTKTP